jgi:hypothetical protein
MAGSQLIFGYFRVDKVEDTVLTFQLRTGGLLHLGQLLEGHRCLNEKTRFYACSFDGMCEKCVHLNITMLRDHFRHF